MNPVTHRDVSHLAALSRLELQEEVLDVYASQLSSITQYVSGLRKTPGDAPQEVNSHTVLRDDVVKGEAVFDTDILLAGAPRRSDTSFVVRAVLAGREESA